MCRGYTQILQSKSASPQNTELETRTMGHIGGEEEMTTSINERNPFKIRIKQMSGFNSM